MRGQNTIVINGKVYDAITGLAVGAPDPIKRSAKAVTKPISVKQAMSDVRRAPRGQKLVRKPQKSQTLKRDYVKKPTATKASIYTDKTKRTHPKVERSQLISKFGSKTALVSKASQLTIKSESEQNTGVRSLNTPKATTSAIRSTTKLSSSQLKKQLISRRLAEIDTKTPAREHQPRHRRRLSTFPVVSGAMALVILAGYLTYLNMPVLSVRVAAIQSNVAATYPSYHPDGYRLDGPVAYQPGEVEINFKANSGNTNFKVSQHKSGWDSQAVYDNYVSKQDQPYQVNTKQGITIYTYGSSAAWVNGGVFYTISGTAPLTDHQLLHIATSM